MIENNGVIAQLFKEEKPDVIIHLAAQAGVRYSIDNPRAYLENNNIGTFEILEATRSFPPKHVLLASTSSAYGATTNMPYRENDKADHQMSFYAAAKKATERMAHSHSHLFNLPLTMFRFFTVYGPWGRADMALFKFTEAILAGKLIDGYNYGNMNRDFTYIDDLVHAIRLLINKASIILQDLDPPEEERLSSVATFRLVNIGNPNLVDLMDYITAIEEVIGKKN